MSKKRFIEGLDSLFADTDTPKKADRPSVKARTKKRGRRQEETTGKSSGKDFSSDLASFLQEAFEESFEQQLEQQETTPRSSETPSPPPRQSGLDALIRNTLEPASISIDPKATRRLVVTFREEQLQKLKTIARSEKTVLKKIVNEIVEDYLRQYDREQKKQK